MRQIIKLQNKHIKKGIPGAINYCPVAWAVAEQVLISNIRLVWVNKAGIDVDYYLYREGKYSRKFVTPRSVIRFMSSFDKGKPVKPFSFKLREKNGR